MRALFILSGLGAFALVTVALGLPQSQHPSKSGEQPLVRMNVDLVQVDVVVTDSKGHPISDLRPDEFEILDNGKPQLISNFSYITGPATTVPPAVTPLTRGNAPSAAMPPA